MKTHNPVIITGEIAYIDNFPKLAWNTGRECTFCGCTELILNSLGCEASYDTIMGLTASCYRTSLYYGWDPGSNILDLINYYLGTSVTDNALCYYGWESFFPESTETRDSEIVSSIENGIPVMVLGGRRAPEWSTVLGYEKTAEGLKFFGRSYFDENAPCEELFTANGYTLADCYPGEAAPLLFRETDRRISFTHALKKSLETCLAMFRPYKGFGYDAYLRMIDSFNNNSFRTSWNTDGEVKPVIDALTDARCAAVLFLEKSTDKTSSKAAESLKQAAELYSEISKTLLTVKAGLSGKNALSDSTYREDAAEKLENCLALEKKAHLLMEKTIPEL